MQASLASNCQSSSIILLDLGIFRCATMHIPWLLNILVKYYLIWHILINLFKHLSKLRSVILIRVSWIDNVKVYANIIMNKPSFYSGFQLPKLKQKNAFIIMDYRRLEETTFYSISNPVFVPGD